jgi:hypothetical protein
MEERIIHLTGAGLSIFTRDPKRKMASFPKRATRKIPTSLLELDRKNGYLTQVHPLT